MTLAVFAKNHSVHLEEAVRIARACPEQQVAFQSKKPWVRAARLLEETGVGAVRVFFAANDGGPMVRFGAWLQEVLVRPEPAGPRTLDLLNLRPPTTSAEPLWSAGAGTLYAVSGCELLEGPIPFAQLLKENGAPLSDDFAYSYAIVKHHSLDDSASPPIVAVDVVPPPARIQAVVSRIIRDAVTVRRLKTLHDHRCQLCPTRLTLSDGSGYSEGHHLQPLGRNHAGPDVAENILVLCPNCHALCDLQVVVIARERLRILTEHAVSDVYLEYHNRLVRSGGAT